MDKRKFEQLDQALVTRVENWHKSLLLPIYGSNLITTIARMVAEECRQAVAQERECIAKEEKP